jgi:hypothetical protein
MLLLMMYPFSANPLCVLATGDCPFNLERTSTCPKHLIVYFRLDNVQPEAGDCWEEACESEVRRIAEVFKEKPRLISAQQANGLRHEEKRKTRRLSEVMRRAWTPDMADYRRRLSLVHPASTLC